MKLKKVSIANLLRVSLPWETLRALTNATSLPDFRSFPAVSRTSATGNPPVAQRIFACFEIIFEGVIHWIFIEQPHTHKYKT